MIKIVARNQVILEKRAEFLTIAAELVQASQAEEGCLAYDVFVNLKDENELTFIEEWKDMEAIEAHNTSEHFLSLVPKINECVAASDVRLYKQA